MSAPGFGCPAIPRNRICKAHYHIKGCRCPLSPECHGGPHRTPEAQAAHRNRMDDMAMRWERM